MEQQTTQNPDFGSSDSEKAVIAKQHATVESKPTPPPSSQDENTEGEDSEKNRDYPTGTRLALIGVALCVSVFLIALDNSIIATAVPRISVEFNSLSDVGWYGSAYLLTTACLQLFFGKLYSYLPIKIVFICAISIFELGSLLCALAQNSVTFIVGRAIAGIGSAGVYSGALVILAHSVPVTKRPLYGGFIGAMNGISSVAGPLLGGVFTDKATWRWCFWINLPLGGLALAIIIFLFTSPKLDEPPAAQTLLDKVKCIDPIGSLLSMCAVICLLLALRWGGNDYKWSSSHIIALLVLFGVLLVGFLYMQWRQGDKATVPPRLMGNRAVYASCIYAFGVGSSSFVLAYYLPVWFQAVQEVSAFESGIRTLPLLLTVALAAILGGAAVTALGYYAPIMLLGTAIMSVGAGLLTTLTPDAVQGHWIGYQAMYGIGVGLGIQQPMIAVQTALDIKDIPTASCMIIFFQTMGGAIFISVAQSVFTNQLSLALQETVAGVGVGAVLAAGATDLRQVVSPALLDGVIMAYNSALTRAFFVTVALSLCSILGPIFSPWTSIKKKADDAKSADASTA